MFDFSMRVDIMIKNDYSQPHFRCITQPTDDSFLKAQGCRRGARCFKMNYSGFKSDSVDLFTSKDSSWMRLIIISLARIAFHGSSVLNEKSRKLMRRGQMSSRVNTMGRTYRHTTRLHYLRFEENFRGEDEKRGRWWCALNYNQLKASLRCLWEDRR